MANTVTFTSPSGRVIRIREHNGRDEAVLTSNHDKNSGGHLVAYLANVIEDADGQKPTTKEICLWGVKDKYYCLYKARMLSLGTNLKREWECDAYLPTGAKCGYSTLKSKSKLSEDLTLFDNPLDNPDTDWLAKNVSAVTPYPMGKASSVTLHTSSGLTLTYDITNTFIENTILDLPDNTRNRTSILRARNLRYADDRLVTDFSELSAKDMVEIFASIGDNDNAFMPLMEIKCPACSTVGYEPIMTDIAFFFPAEI